MSSTSTNAQILSYKQKGVALIAAFAAAGDISRLEEAIHQALDEGLSINESKEVLIQLYAYAGFPRSLNALAKLKKIVDSRKQKGLKDKLGATPQQNILTGEALSEKGIQNQIELAGQAVRGDLFDFAPTINTFLQQHLFGDIFERDNLDWKSRELATVSMLSVMLGVEAQLKAHIGISMRTGLTKGQLKQLAELLARNGEAEAATRIDNALQDF